MPEIGSSLSDGFDDFQQVHDGDDEHLDGLLASLTHLEQKLKSSVQEQAPSVEDGEQGLQGDTSAPMSAGPGDEEQWKTKADIITWRGLITKVCAGF